MVKHWFKFVGDGKNFCSSSEKGIAFLNEKNSNDLGFIKSAKAEDVIWFIRNNTKRKIFGVATFVEVKKREIGPIIAFTQTNEELGWDSSGGKSTHELHYKDLYNISYANVFAEGLSGQSTTVCYKPDSHTVDLPVEYKYIVKYCRPVDKISIKDI